MACLWKKKNVLTRTMLCAEERLNTWVRNNGCPLARDNQKVKAYYIYKVTQKNTVTNVCVNTLLTTYDVRDKYILRMCNEYFVLNSVGDARISCQLSETSSNMNQSKQKLQVIVLHSVDDMTQNVAVASD